MSNLIEKSALLAEIERRYETNLIGAHSAFKNGKIEAFREVKDFLNTLKVKEIDLEKHLKEDIEDVFFDLDGVAVKGATHYLTVEDIKDIAKHFFELGMSVSNKSQKGE